MIRRALSIALVLVLVIVPTVALARKAHPHALTATPALTAVLDGAVVHTTGSGLAPSAGGQEVILWIGSSSDAQDGEYAYPFVGDDGTFATDYPAHGTAGVVRAFEYDPASDVWATVAETTY